MNRLKRKQIDRPKAFWGALISAGFGIINSMNQAERAKKEAQRQANIQDYNNLLISAPYQAQALNAGQDYQQNYLQQFKQQARLGTTRRLGSRNIIITDGGNATKIGNDTYLLRGGSHEQTNETGQTGIGINVGGNEIEAEGGEVAQKKNGALRIFSAQPILGGISPAQAVMNGANKDRVFNSQQQFKRIHHLSDDGNKLKNGGLTSKDRGSSKHPYPSVSSKDFAGSNRSYPIPTKADAVDALRLAGLHGRSDIRSKVYSKYPSLRPKAAFGDWVRTNRDDNALASLLYESGLFDRESWNTMLKDIHTFTGMGGNPYNTDENIDAVMAPAFGSSSTRVLSQLAKSPEASYTLKQVLSLPTKEMIRKRIAGDIVKRIGVARAARQSSNFRNYNIARMQAANAEASFSPFANQVRYAEGKPILVNTNGYYTTAGNTISRNAKNMTSGANPFLYAPRTSNEILEGLSRVIASAKQGAKNVGQKVGNNRAVREFRNLSNKDKAKYIGMTGFAATALPAVSIYLGNKLVGKDNKQTSTQKDAHGKPISQYIARPQAQQPSKPQTKKVTIAQKSVIVPKQVNKTVPKYKGNTTKGNYQLHDGETKIINGIKYTRRGNTIINHKTNVAYIYDKNGNYTGQADYSKVGNFNQAFDAARAAGRKDFIYHAGKYNNYSTIKETDARKERLNRIIGSKRIAKRIGGFILRPKARIGAEIEPYYDWARNTSSNLGISFIDPTYDYRAYYNSVTPYERALIRFAPQGTHFTDIGKTPKHPTFSNESKYSNDKTTGGTWNGNVFVPNIWQFGNNGNNRRNKYMNNSGEGYFNGRVNVFPTSRKRNSLGCRTKLRNGGWKAPVYNTKKYRVSNRMRQQIATWEGSDFAGQNRKFNGDAIGAKERELRQIMGRTYNYLTDNQRDSLNSIYYNSRVDTFKNRFGKWFRNLNDAVDRGDERAFNNSLAGIRQSMNIGENRKGMSGLAKRRAWERNWFGNPIPMDSNETKAILKQQAEARMVQPTDNTRVVIQPEYIEVPAPVGHGVVPVNNTDPNLLQGNIKDNLINMGNKFRLGQRCGGKTRMRCGGSTRMRKALGCESRPVKGMRSKLAWGDIVYPYRRNNNFDYWDIIDQEQKANDKGGISPWTTSNKYDVKVPYAITKSTPTIPYTSKVSTPTSKVTENKTIPTYIGNKSGMILRNADWASLGADLIGTIGAGIIGAKSAGNINIPNIPVPYQASKLNTNYNITPQLESIKRSRNRLANEISNNTSSSVASINRLNLLENNANEQLNKLYNIKENRESELLNQDALNQQSVSAQNIQAMNDYNYRVAELKNARNQAMGNVLTGTLQGIGNSFQNLISQGRQNYDDTQAMLMGVAASDYATPSRLLELGVDVGDDTALAGIYRSAMNIPNPGARPKREDYSDNTEYSYALTRWENQNKAYQRRNSYADLIKGRMSKKNLIKYGII